MIHLFTHDSIGLGEDGPTHQPIEQLASLRAMPHLDVIRPADANEVAEAWRLAIERTHNPVALVLTRQNVPVLDRSSTPPPRGCGAAATCSPTAEGGEPELILIATGSEVQLGVGAHETLTGEGIRSRVVSLPCWEIFDRQDAEYRDEVLPPGVTARVAIEEASTLGWERYVGTDGDDHRHAHLRPVGAVQGRRGGVRLHPGQDRRGGAQGRRARGRQLIHD